MLAVDVVGKSGEFKPSQIERPTTDGSRAGHRGRRRNEMLPTGNTEQDECGTDSAGGDVGVKK